MKILRLSSWGLRKQLMLLIILIFIPVSAILLFTGYKQHQLTLEKIENDAKRLIHLFAEEQLNITSQTRQFLNVLSHVPALRSLDLPRCNEFLQTIHEDTPQYSTIVAANSVGLIECCAIPLKKSINVTDRSWFKRIKASREFVIDTFIISRSAKKASLPFAYPILDADGNLIAAVGAAFDLSYYKQLFEKIPLPQESVIMLTDSEGNILYQSFADEDCLGKLISECRGFDVPEAGKSRFEVSDADGKDRIYWYDWLWAGQESNQICLLVGISKQMLFADLKKTLLTNIGVLSIVALLSLTIAWFSGRKIILDPIRFLVEKTKHVKQGTWIRPGGEKKLPGELHILSQAFDEMIADLSQRETERDQALLAMKKELAVRKKTEAELREREERLNILFEQAADAIYVCKPDGYFSRVNNAACRITGYTEHEMMALNVTELDTVIATPEALNDFFLTLVPGQTVPFESVHRRKDGSTFPVEINIARIKTPAGPCLLEIARDITERKKMEERIQQAQKMESIGNLAGGIAHDFNNILFPIVGLSEMLMKGFPPDSLAYKNAQRIYKAGIRGKELVKQILAFSRQSDHKKIPVKLQQILKEVLNLSRSTIPTNIEISHDIQQDCGQMMADPIQLHQVAMNLITNAYHALDPSGGNISVKLKKTVIEPNEKFSLSPGAYAVLTVSDTGIGIPPDIIGRIFDPYFTTKEKGKGTGLGLATVYGIVKEHGGEIKVYSEPGKGTIFNIYLPLMKAFSETKAVEEKVQVHPAGNERILLVDDEELIADLEKEMLKGLGYQVTARTDSAEALNIFQSNPDGFDLIISDMNMPKMTGDQLVKEVMRIRPDIPVIVCTGFSERLNEEKAEAIGVKAFLMKPVVTSEMAEIVRNVLDQAKNPAQ
jgi:PAS domain S-box-containing protein